MASITAADLCLSDVFVTPHGARISAIKDGAGGSVILQPNEFLRIPFDPSAFNSEGDSQRLTMILEATRPLLEAFADLDEFLVGYLTEHSQRLFSKTLTADEVRANYCSCVRHSDKGYLPTLRTKIDLSGKHALHCWDGDGNRVDAPESWRNRWINPRLHVTHLWMMGPSFGVVVRLTDALLRPDEGAADRSSPF